MGVNAVGASTPHIGEVSGAQAGAAAPVGQLDGRQIESSLFLRLKNSVSELGLRISTFFEGIASKFHSWQDSRAEAAVNRNTAQAKSEAADFLKSLKNGDTSGAQAHLVQVEKYAAKTKPDNLQESVANFLKAAVAEADANGKAPDFSTDTASSERLQKQLFGELRKTDFEGLNEKIQTQLAASEELTEVIARNLAKADLLDSDGPEKEKLKFEHNKHLVKDGLMTVKAAVQEQACDNVERAAHGLFEVDEDGQISQSVHNAKVYVGGVMSGGQAVDLAAKLGESWQANYDKTIPPKSKEGEASAPNPQLATVGGVEIYNKAKDDWPRMDIHFVGANGNEQVSKHQGPHEKTGETLEKTVKFAREFAGSDEAVKVLSCVTSQGEWSSMISSVAGKDGKPLMFEFVRGGFDHATVHGPDGKRQVDDPSDQIGRAKLTVSKTDDGNFALDVNWTAYATGLRAVGEDGNTNSFTLDPNNPTQGARRQQGVSHSVPSALEIQLSGRVILSAEAAHDGKVKVLDTQLEHKFEGRVTS